MAFLSPALLETVEGRSYPWQGRPQIRLGKPGRDPLDPCLVLLDFDDSGSLTVGNDPVGMRYQEARRAIEHIAKASRTGTQQVGVFRFDHPTVPAVGPLPLHTATARDTLLKAIAPPQGVTGASWLSPSMMAMNRMAEQHEDATRIAVIFSDFELLDLNSEQPYEEIAKFPGIVHAVVMNAIPPARLYALPNIFVTRVSSEDPPGYLSAALSHSLTQFRPGATKARVSTRRRRTP